jgi:hypothetical protein
MKGKKDDNRLLVKELVAPQVSTDTIQRGFRRGGIPAHSGEDGHRV